MSTTRAELLRRGALAGGGLAAGAALLADVPGGAQTPAARRRDAEILDFALQLEHIQAALYAAAFDGGRVLGELRELARVVGGHERAHVEFLQSRLGSAATAAPRVDFARAAADPARFLQAGRLLEDLSVRTYATQAANLSPKALAAAARIASVEARHAAWIRDLAGENPAPDAAEPSLTVAEVTAQLRDAGVLR